MLLSYCSCIIDWCSFFRLSSLWIAARDSKVLSVKRCCHWKLSRSFSMLFILHCEAIHFRSKVLTSRTHTIGLFYLMTLRSIYYCEPFAKRVIITLFSSIFSCLGNSLGFMSVSFPLWEFFEDLLAYLTLILCLCSREGGSSFCFLF